MPVFNNILAGASGQTSGGGGDDTGYKVERSLRFNRPDSAYLSRTPSGGNRKKWTLSFWYKPCLATGSDRHCVLEARNSSGHHSVINFRNDHKFEIYHYTTSLQFQVLTTAQFRDPAAWYHFVLAYDTDQSGADKVKMFCNGIRITQFDTASYPSDSYGDALWNDNNVSHTIGKTHTHYLNGYLAEYYFLDGGAPATSTDDASGSVTGTPSAVYLTDFGEFDSTTGMWNPKQFTINNKHTGDWNNNTTGTGFNSDTGKENAFDGDDSTQAAPGQGGTMSFTPAQAITGITKIRIKARRDVGQATDSNFTLNGTTIGNLWSAGTTATVEITSLGGNAITQLTNLTWKANTNNNEWFGVYHIEIFYDGAYHALVQSGVNSFYLDFSDNSSNAALGTDSSGNSNTWTVNNLSVAAGNGNDSLLDSPTNYTASSGNNGGNYATMNPLNHIRNGTLTNGNLEITGGSTTFNGFSTIGVSSGKWYAEITGLNGGGSSNYEIGIVDLEQLGENTTQVFDAFSRGFGYRNDAEKITNNGATNYGATYGSGDVIGMAVDLDNGTLTFYKNGVSQGTAFTNIPLGYTYHLATFVRNASDTIAYNFGQRPFAISSIPSGYKALCTTNLTDPLIVKPSTAFDALAYNGTGGAKSVSLGFSPDLVWTKQRSGSEWNYLIDRIRGNTKAIFSNETNTEFTTNAQVLTAFNSDGYSLGSDSAVNALNQTYIGWSWDGGDLFTNSAYNQSQSWSSATLSDGTNLLGLFDGDNSTRCEQDTNGTAASITNFGPVSVANTVSFYSPDGNARYTLNGGDEVAVSGTGWHDISFSGTLTSFTFQAPGNSRIFIFGMKIDGKELVDPGLIPVGSLNSSVYDQSTVWSDYLTTNETGTQSYCNSGGFFENNGSGHMATEGFNGSLTTTTATCNDGDGKRITFTPPSAYSYSEKVEVYLHGSQTNSVYINGNDTGVDTVADSWATVATGSGSITSMWFESDTAGHAARFAAIRIDGKLLVDQGVSVTNVPSIASTVRANQTAGFSIATFSAPNGAGNTVAHGLNAKPAFFFYKNLDYAQNWGAYHTSLGANYGFNFNEPDGKYDDAGYFNDTEPTSNVITFGTYPGAFAGSGTHDHVLYAFTTVEGYSSVGKWTGNGDEDGPFIYTGFRPRWILIKSHAATNSNAHNHWSIYDTERNVGNEASNLLLSSAPGIELNSTHTGIDIMSNGFKMRGDTGGYANYSTNQFVYFAIAENPFKYARAR